VLKEGAMAASGIAFGFKKDEEGDAVLMNFEARPTTVLTSAASAVFLLV